MTTARLDYDILIIGGGIAGLSALQESAYYGLRTAVLEGSGLLGGQVANITHLESVPGINGMSGMDLAMSLLEASKRNSGIVVETFARDIQPHGMALRVETDQGRLTAQAVVVASGAKLKMLGVPGADKFVGSGISQCAACDGPLFRQTDVVVIGGGDAALHEALVLAPICRSVSLVVRRQLRARRSYIDRVKATAAIKFVWDSEVTEMLGNGKISGVRIRDTMEDASREIPCSAVFPFIGTTPDVDFLPAAVKRSETGAIVTDGRFATAMPGVYAIGAARAGYSGELSSAMGEASAAIKAIARAIN